MPFRRGCGCLVGVTGICLLALSASSCGAQTHAGVVARWRDFGRLLLCQLGTSRILAPEWLDDQLGSVDPDASGAVRIAEIFLTDALAAYGRDVIAVEGRISLEVHPQCIWGLYIAQRFSQTRLGDWGQRQFEMCVEQASLAAMFGAGSAWRARLEEKLLAADRASLASFQVGTFVRAEAPYLYLYLADASRSVEVRRRARECLALCLCKEHGLKAGLSQYLILLEQGHKVDDTWLEVARQLERIGHRHAATELYEQILANADSFPPARAACEELARMLIAESRQAKARTALSILSQRFPNEEFATQEIRRLAPASRANREDTARRLVRDLVRTRSVSRGLRLCRVLDALWMPTEAPRRWQSVVDETQPGTLAGQLSRVFLARAMLEAGEADAADALAKELTQSPNGFARAQGIAVSADIAQAKGNPEESVSLYAKAVQISRHTALPSWCKLPLQVQSSQAGVPMAGLQMRGLFLKACNDLIDGDYYSAIDGFRRAATDPHLLPTSLQRVLPRAMMLACLRTEDYAGAEAWGYRALVAYRMDHPNDNTVADLLVTTQRLDMAVVQAVISLRAAPGSASAFGVASEQAIPICDLSAELDAHASYAGAGEAGIKQLYVQAKKNLAARVLTAECRYTCRRIVERGEPGPSLRLEPLVFAAQVLGGESIGRIRENLASLTEDEGIGGRMYRFALFAQGVNRQDLTEPALDVAASEQASGADTEYLNEIAEMHLAASRHRKAIAAYEMIAGMSEDSDAVEHARRKIVDLHEDMGRMYHAGVARAWRDLGRLVLYRLETGRGLSAEWLDAELEVEDPNSGKAIRKAETVLLNALDAYGQDTMAVMGRIPLNINPQCILGLYTLERFPGTRLGDWGREQFERCVAQASLATMPKAGDKWAARVEADMLAVAKVFTRPFLGGAFTWAEAPYLYFYLIHNAHSERARNRAREGLGRCLLEEHGLEPGLRQYVILLDQGYDVDGTWLEAATQFERAGAHIRAASIYEQIIENALSVEAARRAFEGLTHILLLRSRQGEAWEAWSVLSERFGDVECASPDVREFLAGFQGSRMDRSGRFPGELAAATSELQALELCRRFDALWTPAEAIPQWQAVVDAVESGSPAEQLGRVFLARASLGAGKADAAESLIKGLTDSLNPLVRAQSMALLAAIARTKGDVKESTRLYSSAVRIERQTFLPSWCRGLVPAHSPVTGESVEENRTKGLFLRGYDCLLDGDYAAAAHILGQLVTEPRSLPTSMRRALPCAMMLAYLGMEDYVEAEVWGYQAIAALGDRSADDREATDFLGQIWSLDAAVARSVTRARDQTTGAPDASAVRHDAVSICDAGMMLDLAGLGADAIGSGIQQLYVRVKKRHTSQVLAAEHAYASEQSTERRAKRRAANVEPLLFAALVLSGDSFDSIRERLSSLVTDAVETSDWLYRFAMFAQRVKRLDIATSALDAGTSENASAAHLEALEGIAEMYLEASNHLKAIDIYRKVAAKSKDLSKGRAVLIKIIDIYAEDVKNYEEAIRECEAFIARYPDSSQTSYVEFYIGKLAYLNRDYAGAAGQLDGFQKRYREHPQVGQAMLLAGLSRMAEGNTQEAIGRFSQVIRRYPDGDLAPRSKFLIGYAQLSEQKYDASLETFGQLIEQFPESQYVAQAQSLIERLQRISR